jgi:hypothetical protein
LLQLAQICTFNIAVLVNTQSYAECINILLVNYVVFEIQHNGDGEMEDTSNILEVMNPCVSLSLLTRLVCWGWDGAISVVTRQWARRSGSQKHPDQFWGPLSLIFSGFWGSLLWG